MIQIDTQDNRFTLGQSRFDSPVYMGRDPDMQVVLAHWRVARRHAVLLERSHTLWIKDLGTWSGTWVNHKRIVAETPVLEEDDIRIGPCVFRARWVNAPVTPACQEEQRGLSSGDDRQSALSRSGRLAANEPSTNTRCDPDRRAFAYARANPSVSHGPDQGRASTSDSRPGEWDRSRSDAPECLAATDHPDGQGSANCASHMNPPRDINRSSEANPPDDAPDARCSNATDPLPTPRTAFDATKTRQRLQSMLLNALDLRREDVSGMSDQHLRARAQAILEALIDHDPDLCPADQRATCIKAVVDEAVGLGPLEPLLADDGVSEIMVNRYDEIYVERAGRLERANVAFANDLSVLSVIERIVAPLGRRIDEGSPMVDARLSDGSRVNGVIAPIALKGPALTIRKFARRKLQLADLVAGESLSAHMAAFLTLCVAHKKNMVVSGGTGSGKTTLLNILSGLIGQRERIITIEDAAELQLPHEHVVALEARPANIEGRGRVDIRDLVRNALRMRPDRIVVGECRGAEAFDMLAAMNTGHEGSLTTLHANTPRDALARLETMILMTGMPLPLAAVREHISSGIDIIVQQARLDSGQRVLTDIAEVTGMDSGGIQLQTLFSRHKGHGGFAGAGVLPSFVEAWRERSIDLPAHWFDR